MAVGVSRNNLFNQSWSAEQLLDPRLTYSKAAARRRTLRQNTSKQAGIIRHMVG
jgi:hypothetical protein